MEIIKRFLEGEQDPEYEVIPTVTEGKYFVKPRKQAGSKREHSREARSKEGRKERINEGPTGSEDIVNEDPMYSDDSINESRSKDFSREHSRDSVKVGVRTTSMKGREHSRDSNKVQTKPKPPKPPQHHGANYSTPYYDPTISYQILEQLKLLGEEQRQRRQKKEQKKLVKHQIKKHMGRTKKQDSEEDSDNEDFSEDNIENQTKPEPEQEFQVQAFPVAVPSRRRVNLLK